MEGGRGRKRGKPLATGKGAEPPTRREKVGLVIDVGTELATIHPLGQVLWLLG